MSTIKVTGLNVIAFYVTDIEKSRAFFIDHLGFEKSKIKMNTSILLNQGDLTICLEKVETQRDASHLEETEVCPCFGTDGVKDAYKKLSAAGVEIVTEYTQHAPTFGLFRIADPDGNLIEFAGHP